jgi:hypothetical protein
MHTDSSHRRLERARQDTLIVLGNGPSLRGFDFRRLEGFDTLGMNAAYRYWRSVDWSPTYYACLDDALIDTHHAEITKMIQEGRIQRFFLTGHMLEHHPDLADHPSVDFLDSYVPHWHNLRGKSFALPLKSDPAFQTDMPNFLTTGSYAVRYGASLSYEQIYLLGIDLTYVDLESAKATSRNRLLMTETPQYNPNYFFDGYQQAGDEFHVPNPTEHSDELHVAAFVAVRDDFHHYGVKSRVINANPSSRLSTDAIFPYCNLSQMLDEPVITTIAIPLTSQEHDQLLANLWLWAQPAFFPYLGTPPERPPDLLFVCNTAEAAAVEQDIQAALKASPRLRMCFDRIQFINLALSGHDDVYQRENDGPASPKGRRAGPNNMFFAAMDALKSKPGHTLYMETDCVPLVPDWLNGLELQLLRTDAPWILGSMYRGLDALGPNEKRHINGNAIYATGDPAFQRFVTTVWRPKLNNFINDHPEMPYDCLIEALFQRADAAATPPDPLWQELQDVSQKFAYSSAIINLAGSDFARIDVKQRLQTCMEASPGACIVHSRDIASYVEELRNSDKPVSLRNLLQTETLLPDGSSRARTLTTMRTRRHTSVEPSSLARIGRGLKRRLNKLKHPEKRR